jgi:rRNA-processing protein FCF1
MKIILDTNFLIDLIRFKVDIRELRGNNLFVTDSIVFELNKIAKRKTSEAIRAKLALGMIEAKGLKTLKSIEKNTDQTLVAYSQINYAIATQDSLLKTLIRKRGGKVIYIRQKKYVVM